MRHVAGVSMQEERGQTRVRRRKPPGVETRAVRSANPAVLGPGGVLPLPVAARIAHGVEDHSICDPTGHEKGDEQEDAEPYQDMPCMRQKSHLTCSFNVCSCH